jgi:hypothetical protein
MGSCPALTKESACAQSVRSEAPTGPQPSPWLSAQFAGRESPFDRQARPQRHAQGGWASGKVVCWPQCKGRSSCAAHT